jgi:hypothetical protein
LVVQLGVQTSAVATVVAMDTHLTLALTMPAAHAVGNSTTISISINDEHPPGDNHGKKSPNTTAI